MPIAEIKSLVIGKALNLVGTLKVKTKNFISTVDALPIPYGIGPVALFSGLTFIILFYITLISFGSMSTSSVLNKHEETLAFTTVYIENEMRIGSLIAAGTVSSGEDDIQNKIVSQVSQKDFNKVYKQSDIGFMPRVANDGTTVFSTFKQDSVYPEIDKKDTEEDASSSKKPGKIALIMLNAGLKKDVLRSVLSRLPNAISLAYSPYSDGLSKKVERSFALGYENWIMFPGETQKFPLYDPGPLVFLRNVNPSQNIRRLEQLVSSSTRIIGLVAIPENIALTNDQEQVTMARALKEYGMGYIHDKNNLDIKDMLEKGSVPYFSSSAIIDSVPTQSAIQKQLEKLEFTAKKGGNVLAYFNPYPITVNTVEEWVETLEENNINLVSVSKLQ